MGKDKFLGLQSELWTDLTRLSSHVYPARVELFRQGSPADEVYCLDRGLVKLVRLELDGDELIVDIGFPGSLLGSASATLQRPHPVTATALTECCVRCISADIFRQLLRANAQLSWDLHKIHSEELLDQIVRIAQLGCQSARCRLERLLWRFLSVLQPDEWNREARLQLPLRHWEIAQLIAATPPYLCSLLKELEKDGIVRRRKGWLIFPDPLKLKASVELLNRSESRQTKTGRNC